MLQLTLKQAREACDYTTKEVANHCGLTEESYSEIEKDFSKATAGVAYAVHSLLKISLDTLA